VTDNNGAQASDEVSVVVMPDENASGPGNPDLAPSGGRGGRGGRGGSLHLLFVGLITLFGRVVLRRRSRNFLISEG